MNRAITPINPGAQGIENRKIDGKVERVSVFIQEIIISQQFQFFVPLVVPHLSPITVPGWLLHNKTAHGFHHPLCPCGPESPKPPKHVGICEFFLSFPITQTAFLFLLPHTYPGSLMPNHLPLSNHVVRRKMKKLMAQQRVEG